MRSWDTKLWNSNNPLRVIPCIDISGDDGAVIISEYKDDHWDFMTLEAIGAGNHPVSGTRRLWSSFQSNLNSYIQKNHGQSFIPEASKFRPDWDKVKEVLEGKIPISTLGC